MYEKFWRNIILKSQFMLDFKSKVFCTYLCMKERVYADEKEEVCLCT